MRCPSTILVFLTLLLSTSFAQETPPEPPPPAQEAPVPEVRPASPPAPGSPTLGEFVLKAAAALNLPPPPGGFIPESAAWALTGKGVKVRPDLKSPATDADAVDLLTGLGFKIRTTTPSRLMSRDRMEILVSAFLRSPQAGR